MMLGANRPSIRFHGTRGSVPVSRSTTSRYGGATTCFEFSTTDDSHLIVDFGTGILNADWVHKPSPSVSVLLTHLHWDHVLGMPFAPFVFDPGAEIDFYSGDFGHDLATSLGAVICPPYFPIRLEDAASKRRYHTLDRSPVAIAGWNVTFSELLHPGGSLGYRLERDGRSVVIITDVEPGDPASDADMAELAADANVLVVDAQYDVEELETSRAGWGHGSWKSAAELATTARADRLLLTSHDPWRSDDAVDEFVARAREIFPETAAAADGMDIVI